MQISQGAKFERPLPGMYLATLVDVVDLPNQQTQYGIKNRIRFHWVLAYLTGQPYIGKDGKPVEATAQYNANMGTKADLPKRLTQILGQAPPVIESTEQLEQLVLGRSNVLVLVAAPNPKDANDPFINVDGIGPITAGMPAPPPIPQGYVRSKNRPKTQAGPQGQPVQTYASPQAAQQAQQTQQQAYAYPQQQPQTGYPAPAPAPVAAPQYQNPNTVNLNTPPAAVPQGAPVTVPPQGNRPF